MHPKHHARQILLGLVALFLMMGGAVQAQPLDRSGTVIVPVGGAVRLQMKSKKLIKQVFNERENIVQAQADAANPAYVILRGQQQGTSRLELTDADNGKETYEVVVQTDIDLLRNILKRAVPTANVEVIPFGNGVVITGNVARAEDVDTVLRVAGTVLGSGAANVVNAMTVGGVQQVQLDVTVARVDRTKTRQRGFSFIFGGTTVSAGSVLGGLTGTAGSAGNNTIATGVGIIPGAVSALPTSLPNLVLGIVPAQFQGLLQALKVEGLAKLIAEPKLVTQSGRPARFLSGGQQPTIGPTSGITGPGVVYQDVGTELDFLPIVYGNGKIYLEVAPRIRAVNFGNNTINVGGTTVPAFDDQSVRTSIVMEAGQTFAIGGLIQTSLQATSTKVPFLGELPFFGVLFSQTSQTEQESELVILVTPHLVDPMDCNQVPGKLPGRESRSPDDFEMYLEGMLELPRGQRNVFENKHYKGAWKNSPTAAAFPCGAGIYGHGNCATGNGACANGTCATAATTTPRMATVIPVDPIKNSETTLPRPVDLPAAVSIPKDLPMSSPRSR
ncbi:MAG: hypothetical protein K8T89_05960 [Planctomycetes bacterium]|nr:hypothetical protein [Planctomycetota bacterium]